MSSGKYFMHIQNEPTLRKDSSGMFIIMSVVLSCDMFVSYAICVIKMLATRTPPTFLSLLPWLVLYDLSPVDIQVLDV